MLTDLCIVMIIREGSTEGRRPNSRDASVNVAIS
jgi:hypothetical protein